MKQSHALPVVIVGGGFAGVTLAQHLEKQLDQSVEIIVISKDNHLVFTPMLPEVAARTISPMQIVIAGRQMTKRTTWMAASTTRIDFEKKVIDFELSYGEEASISFGDLILACGMDVNLDEISGMAAYALPLKSIDDAFALGNVMVGKFEQAVIEPDKAVREQLLTTVVIGGGFSGVEIAGHLFDLAKGTSRYYKFADGVTPRMIVIQRGDRILPELQHDSLSGFALKQLRKNGVEVLLQTGVKEVGRNEVHLADGRRIRYGLLVGTVGNTATALIKGTNLPLERNRLKTAATMQVPDVEHVWAIGDCALVPNAFDGKMSPSTAQYALRQAKQLAANIRRSREGQTLAPFRFRPQGLLASIGQRNGVAEIYGFRFSGLIAWGMWRAIYLMKMPSLARKTGIAVDWLMGALFSESAVLIGDRGSPRLRKEHHLAGDVVYREGEPSRTLYFIERGTATVHNKDQSGPVTRLNRGEYFSLSAVEEKATHHTTTVVAETSLDLLALDRPSLQELSRDSLNHELVRLLELRRIRESWKDVVERFPAIDKLRVADAMVERPEVIRDDESLATVARRIVSAVSLPVIDSHGKLIGSCGRAEVSAALAQAKDLGTPAKDLIVPCTITFAADLPLRNATNDFLRSGLDAIPVVDADSHLIGMFGLIEAALRLAL